MDILQVKDEFTEASHNQNLLCIATSDMLELLFFPLQKTF